MNYYTVDVLSPNAIIAKNIPCESLIIPTVRGQINVLPEHTHLITELDNGHMVVFGGADDPTRSFLITGGICKVLNEKVTILTTAGEEDRDIDLERAKLALENSLEHLRKGDLSPGDFEKYERKVERARLRIQLAEEDIAGKSK